MKFIATPQDVGRMTDDELLVEMQYSWSRKRDKKKFFPVEN